MKRGQFTSIAALQRTYAKLGLDGRATVNTYGELKAFIRVPQGAQAPDDLEPRFLAELRAADTALANQLKTTVDQRKNPDDAILNLDRPLVQVTWLTADSVSDDEELSELFQQTEPLLAARLRLDAWFPHKGGTARRQSNPPIITFYSFKGGVGRSTSLAFCALELARRGYRVAVVDMDLEAPGVTAQLQIPPNELPPGGVVDYLYRRAIRFPGMVAEDVRSHLVKVPHRITQPGEVWVMPAGRVDATYPERLARIDLDLYQLQPHRPLDQMFEDIAETIQPDVILVDSRTGIAEVGGAMLFHHATAVVSLFHGDLQSRQGVEVLLSRLAALSPESRPAFTWVHSLLRLAPGQDAGFHAETQEFLRRAYDQWGLSSDRDAWAVNEEDSEYRLFHVRRLETLDLVTEQGLLDPAVYSHYHPLVERLISLLPSRKPHPAVAFTQRERLALLEQVERGFSASVAEAEPYHDRSYAEQHFLVTPSAKDVVDNDSKFLVIGGRGSGKSALVQMLLHHPDLITPPTPAADRFFYAGHLPGKEQTPERWFYGPDAINELERRRVEAGLAPDPFWMWFWATYACLRLHKELGPNFVHPSWAAIEQLASTLGAADHLDHLWAHLTDPERAWETDMLLEELEGVLRALGQRYILVYDGLDQLIAPAQLAVYTGLISFWGTQMAARKYLLGKVFLSVGAFRLILTTLDAAKTLAHVVTLHWSSEDLHRLILGRALSNSPELCRSLRRAGLLPGGEAAWALPHDRSGLESIIHHLFGDRVSTRGGRTYAWLDTRLRDAHTMLYVAGAMQMVRMACQQARHLPDRPARLIPAHLFVQLLPEISRMRLRAAAEEFPELAPLLDRLAALGETKPWRVPVRDSHLASLVEELLPPDRKQQTHHLVVLLRRASLVEYTVQPDRELRYTVPDLILPAIGATRVGPR